MFDLVVTQSYQDHSPDYDDSDGCQQKEKQNCSQSNSRKDNGDHVGYQPWQDQASVLIASAHDQQSIDNESNDVKEDGCNHDQSKVGVPPIQVVLQALPLMWDVVVETREVGDVRSERGLDLPTLVQGALPPGQPDRGPDKGDNIEDDKYNAHKLDSPLEIDAAAALAHFAATHFAK